jgi:putative ABC transport system substrate-binding protein
MRRREFIAALGAAAVWSLTARAMPVIGYLTSGSSNERPYIVTAFRQGLREAGYVDGCG